MSDQTPDELPDAPAPEATPPEPDPGGADAIPTGDGVHSPDTGPVPIPRDPDPSATPSRDVVPDAVKEGEDTSTAATTSDDAGTSADEEASS